MPCTGWMVSEKARLAAGLREHLASDEFVMNLLRTSVNTAFLNGRLERRLFWNELIEDYGDEFPGCCQAAYSLSRWSRTKRRRPGGS